MMDKINLHVLCFTEHHMLEENLCLTGIENYELASNFSLHTYQKGGIYTFIRNNICFTCLDLSKHYDQKHSGNLCCTIRIHG
jgi:hypothetical protein